MNMLQKAGLKMGLIEHVPGTSSAREYESADPYPDPAYNFDPLPEAEQVEDVNLDSLVQDVYDANGMTDLSKSIFKARDVINTLPKEMATDTKRGAVIGILASFGLTTEDIVADGQARINALQSNNAQIAESNSAEIAAKNDIIEDLKNQIEALSKEIANLENTTSRSDDLISEEIKKIQSLIDFMLGGK